MNDVIPNEEDRHAFDLIQECNYCLVELTAKSLEYFNKKLVASKLNWFTYLGIKQLRKDEINTLREEIMNVLLYCLDLESQLAAYHRLVPIASTWNAYNLRTTLAKIDPKSRQAANYFDNNIMAVIETLQAQVKEHLNLVESSIKGKESQLNFKGEMNV